MEFFNCRLIKFTASDKVKLEGILLGTNKKTCLIYLHGMNGNFYKNSIPFELSKQDKFSVFSINTRGHDVISTARKENSTRSFLAGTGAEIFTDCIKDIEGAIGVLENLGFKKIILSGHSTGCQKATYYVYKKKDKRVSAVMLFAPADDYSIMKKELGKNFNKFSRKIRKNLKDKKNLPLIDFNLFTSQRLNSAYNNKSIEASIFNYDDKMEIFSKIKVPVFAVFGSSEEYKDRPVSKYISILKSKTTSPYFYGKVIKNAKHSFYGYEKDLKSNALDFINNVIR
ncbi:MAG: alpha/beta fold hydrolase [Candidatus Micrarchaeia archaeon]